MHQVYSTITKIVSEKEHEYCILPRITVVLHLKDMDKYVEMEEIIYRTNDLLSGKCDEIL